jgi:hypothetical protein
MEPQESMKRRELKQIHFLARDNANKISSNVNMINNLHHTIEYQLSKYKRYLELF